jgi:hypothetical protein
VLLSLESLHARKPSHTHTRPRAFRTSAQMCCARTLVARAGTGGIYSSAATVGRPSLRFALVIGRSRALAAGGVWVSRTTSAGWAARDHHTSVIDAAGAIYVIGGTGSTGFNDVYASTDGGADRTKSGVVGGYSVGTTGYSVYRGGTGGVSRCTKERTKAYQGGFRGARRGV